jgi:hypothetical protein
MCGCVPRSCPTRTSQARCRLATHLFCLRSAPHFPCGRSLMNASASKLIRFILNVSLRAQLHLTIHQGKRHHRDRTSEPAALQAISRKNKRRPRYRLDQNNHQAAFFTAAERAGSSKGRMGRAIRLSLSPWVNVHQRHSSDVMRSVGLTQSDSSKQSGNSFIVSVSFF